MAMRYEGWGIRTAHDGLSAVRMAREFKPDAVVLDVMLPDLNGVDVELGVPLAANLAATVLRFVLLRGWVFRSRAA